MLKMRLCHGHPIFNMGILIHEKTVFILRQGLGSLKSCCWMKYPNISFYWKKKFHCFLKCIFHSDWNWSAVCILFILVQHMFRCQTSERHQFNWWWPHMQIFKWTSIHIWNLDLVFIVYADVPVLKRANPNSWHSASPLKNSNNVIWCECHFQSSPNLRYYNTSSINKNVVKCIAYSHIPFFHDMDLTIIFMQGNGLYFLAKTI